jgi:4-amino-4-deoxy-L-arabinose transferase-like glycosyltransferase
VTRAAPALASAPARTPRAATGGGSTDPGRWAAAAGLVGLLAVIGWLFLDGVARYPALADDEGTYVAQAWAVLQRGELAHYTYWYDHPPLGWIQLAGLTGLFGPLPPEGASVVQARHLMLVPALAAAALLYVVARRLGLRRPFALLAVAAFGLSPLALPLLRQVYLDNVALPWALAAMALALDRRGRLWPSAAAGACLAVAVLSKETMLLLLPAVLVASWQRADVRTRAFTLTALGCAFVLGVLGYPLYALLKGELVPGPDAVSLLDAVWFQLVDRASTGSGLEPGTQSHDLVVGWLESDAVLVAGGCLLAPVALLDRALRPAAVAALVLVAAALRPGYLPAMFVVALLPFCAVLLAGAADRVLAAVRQLPGPALGRAALGLTVVALVAGALAVGDRRAEPLATLATADATGPTLAAATWIEANVDPRARILVDDTLFVDLAEAGFDPGLGVVWFYKLDFTTNLDPSVVRALPTGGRGFDYVVSTPIVRGALANSPGQLQEVRIALESSTPVATFGAGKDVVEVRILTGPDTGSGRLAEPR